MATTSIFPSTADSQSGIPASLDAQAQYYIRDSFWPGSTSAISEYTAYFRYFQWTLESVIWSKAQTEKLLFTVQQYRDLALVVKFMQEHIDDSRQQIATRLQDQFQQSSHECISRSMDLATRLWMTIHVSSNDVPIGPLMSNVTTVSWKPKQSLRSLVQATFPRSRKAPFSMPLKSDIIDPGFNIMNIRNISRIKVQWTHNLKDHLHFDHSTRTISIYPHKVCLLNHLERCNVYPKDLLVETLQTLDLLFPYGDKSTEQWLESQGHSFYRTSSSHVGARASNFNAFCYWKPQLTELHYIYQQPPTTIPQIWYDRRNPMQWYTFFLAVAIAILTSVFGSLGVYIGFKQIELAERSIEIALAQSSHT